MKFFTFNSNSAFIKCLYGILVIMLVLLFFNFSLGKYKLSGKIVESAFTKRDSLIRSAIDFDRSNLVQIQKLKQQNEIICEIKASYLYMAENFTRYGFAFTWIFTITSILTAIVGFLIFKKGWDNTTNDYLKITFMVFFFFSTLSGIVPKVFNNKENAQNNLIKYNYYSALQMDIYDLVKDNRQYIQNNRLHELDSCISLINKNIKENQNLYFDIFIEKVPSDIKVGIN